ncbi:butyrophilin-like protein 2 isoform X2 [Cololabis saira]|uniref:butyrophilin-like protein 2 isoform X2 n=1 Tax=Cololabis saira TaxID=129043 RepID=UPI002AD42469|nr:butyrophilin-like protein 2 isoform X2 [Cololabis saira]XP_061583005.1 butyrophilin-like protein 2 isoform X2 [Cololabis saira]
MLNPRVCSVMELLPLVCLWVLTWSGGISADPNGPLIRKIIVAEENAIVLNCSTSFGASINEGNTFKWMKDGSKTVYDTGTENRNQDQEFKGRVFPFTDKLQSGNASIVINKTKVADSGNYTCDFPQEDPSRRSKIELTVHCTTLKDRTEENIPGTCPTPAIRTLNINDPGHVECKVVDASPKPEVEVRDSTGTRVPAKEEKVSENGNYYIVLTAVVTMEGYYHCVVKQSEICHQIKSPETYASPHGTCPTPVIRHVKSNDGVHVECKVVDASPKPEVEVRDSSGTRVPAKEEKVSENGNYYIVLTANVPKEDNYHCVVKQSEICHQIKSPETYASPHGTCPTPVIRHVKSNDGVDLECKVVDASPKPEVEVRDSSGTRVPDKEEKVSENGNDYIVLTAVVTMEDYYHCVVEQSEICHQIKSPETYASPHDSTLKISANGGLLVFLVLFLLLLDLQ